MSKLKGQREKKTNDKGKRYWNDGIMGELRMSKFKWLSQSHPSFFHLVI
jgi:hypothetical protein